MPDGALYDLCSLCGGTGVGCGPNRKQPSPVDPGLSVWAPPDCPACEGSGAVSFDVEGSSDPVCQMHDWPWSYHGASERAEHTHNHHAPQTSEHGERSHNSHCGGPE